MAAVTTDAEIGADFRQYARYWASISRDERLALLDEIATAERTRFPWRVAIEALAELSERTLWRTFQDEELQDLYDWAEEGNMPDAAESFGRAIRARVYLDDGLIPPVVKQLVLDRAGHHCEAPGCGATDDLCIDHKVIPWSHGGSSSDPENLQVLCRSCNSSKGTRPAPVSIDQRRAQTRRDHRR